MNKYENQNLKYQPIEEGLDELNYKLKEGKYTVAILEKIDMHNNVKSINTKETYLFKPQFERKIITELGDSQVIIFAEAYTMNKGIYWTKLIKNDIIFSQKFLKNVNSKDINPLNEKEWNGINIYVKEDLEKYIEDNFKNNIGFKRNYNLLKRYAENYKI